MFGREAFHVGGPGALGFIGGVFVCCGDFVFEGVVFGCCGGGIVVGVEAEGGGGAGGCGFCEGAGLVV